MSTALKLASDVGIFGGISNAAYHSTEHLSSTGLKYLAQSPAHFKAYKEGPRETTSAMLLGTAIHSMVLEGEKGEVLLAPGSTRTTKLYKDFAAENPGKILLLEDEWDRMNGAIQAIRNHPLARAMLSKGRAEHSVFWNDPETGVPCKCRPDFLRDDGVVIDLKTTTDASERAFQSSIMKFKYHWQSAWYLDGLKVAAGIETNQFVHLVVETEAPFGVNLFVLDDASLEKAREDIRRLLGIYSECLHTGEWPAYEASVKNLALPSWAWSQE